jgi:DNA-binding GntR family transcriptional regulator
MQTQIQKQEPLYIQVYEVIKNFILEGRWEPGEKLVESQIAIELSLSRSPIREAFRMLEYEGLLVKKDQSIYVHKPSIEDMIELYQCRYSLEALSAELAASNATKEDLDEISYILSMTEEVLKENDAQKIVDWNTRFHDSVVYASKNKQLISLMDGLRSKILYCRNVLTRFDYYRTDNFMPEHYHIFESIKKGRSDEAKKSMENHIKTDLACILAVFEEKQRNSK